MASSNAVFNAQYNYLFTRLIEEPVGSIEGGLKIPPDPFYFSPCKLLNYFNFLIIFTCLK